MASYDDERFEHHVSQRFHCAICLNVLNEPVMCQNQHCFCSHCIRKHLENYHNCPTCQEELIPETLNPVPQLFKDCLSELKIRCNYFSRGCQEYVQLGDLSIHANHCEYGPVMCSNEECRVEINKRDKQHHESEVCEFRRVKCHNCEEMKKEVDEMKKDLQGMKNNLGEVTDKIDAMSDGLGRNIGKAVKDAMEEMKEQLTRSFNEVQEKIMKEIEGRNIGGMNPRVIIAGGWSAESGTDKVKMLECSTMCWIPLEEMKQERCSASSVVYNNEMMVIGGLSDSGIANEIERLSMKLNTYPGLWSDFPAKLPVKLCAHRSVVYNDRLLIVGGLGEDGVIDSIQEVLLVPPYTARQLTRMQQARQSHGVQLYNDKIVICGGKGNYVLDTVVLYDITNNDFIPMPSLPYPVEDMATVMWNDNIIIIGGVDGDREVLKSVIIYNVKTGKSHFLPELKTKKYGCAAVVAGNNIIVMGGRDEEGNNLKSVEKFSFDSNEWEDLPPMNEARLWATAVVV